MNLVKVQVDLLVAAYDKHKYQKSLALYLHDYTIMWDIWK